MLQYLFIIIIIISLVIIGYSLAKMYNDIDLFKKIVIYDQMKKRELINNNKEILNTKINNNVEILNTKINNDIESAVQGFNIQTEGLNNLTNYIYATSICNVGSNKVRKSDSDNTKLSESELESLDDIRKNTNRICCNNPDVSQTLKDTNFSCYPNPIDSFGNYKKIENFSEDETPLDTPLTEPELEEPELEDIPEIIDTGNIPMPEPTETTLNNSKLLESEFADKLSGDGTPYDGLSIPGDLKISKKDGTGAIVHIDGKNTRLCGTGTGRMCSYFPYKNKNTYIRPGKRNTNNIYITHANEFRAKNKNNILCGEGGLCSYLPYKSNDTYIRPGKNNRNIYLTHAKYLRAENNSNILCGRGRGRLCSYLPNTNNHTFIRPGNRNKNIYIGGTRPWNETNTTVINSKNPVQIKSGIKIDKGKELCIDDQCLTKDDIKKLKDL